MTDGPVLIAPGAAEGDVLRLEEPLSLWGGIDPATGRIIDVHHPQCGASVAGRVLVMPSARGSSSSASILAEAVRAGTAPVAIVLEEADLILAIGAAVADELYAVRVPIAVAALPASVRDGARVRVDEEGLHPLAQGTDSRARCH